MALGLTPTEYSLEQLFSGNVHYEVPPYQREYQWKVEQCNALYDDIVENETGYFLGTLIGVKNTEGKSPVVQVVDGQQRLTTLAIFLVAIDKVIRGLSPTDEDIKDDGIKVHHDLQDYFCSKDVDFVSRFIPQHQNHNRLDFFTLLTDTKILKKVKFDEKNAGNRRIHRSFSKFVGWINEYIDDLGDDNAKCQRLVELYEKVSSVDLILITVDSNSHAYQLFESLNNRGLPLSAIDLIKNKLLSRLETGKAKISDSRRQQWDNIIELLGGDVPAVQKRFLQQSYNAFRRELNKPFKKGSTSLYPLGSIATQSKLIDIYDSLIGKTPAQAGKFLDWLEDKAKIYGFILGNKLDASKKNLQASLMNLVRVQGAPSYSLVLFLLGNQAKLGLSDGHVKDVVDFLVKYQIRRNVTDYPATNTAIGRFQDVIAAIDEFKHSGAAVVSEIIRLLSADVSDEPTFRRGLEGDIYKDNPECAKFILAALCESAKTKEFSFDLWERDDKGRPIWTIEHIFPEGQNIPKCWVDMIGGGKKAVAERYQEDYVHKIGNLTITGYNSTLSNKSFLFKRDHRDSEGNPIGYNNKLPINRSLESETSWDVSKIQKRGADLVDAAIKLFKF